MWVSLDSLLGFQAQDFFKHEVFSTRVPAERVPIAQRMRQDCYWAKDSTKRQDRDSEKTFLPIEQPKNVIQQPDDKKNMPQQLNQGLNPPDPWNKIPQHSSGAPPLLCPSSVGWRIISFGSDMATRQGSQKTSFGRRFRKGPNCRFPKIWYALRKIGLATNGFQAQGSQEKAWCAMDNNA